MSSYDPNPPLYDPGVWDVPPPPLELPWAPSGPPADPYQQRVIDARESSIRVLAPAGSGKTETLVRRVAARIAEGVRPGRILVLTFDNNAKASFEGKVRTHIAGRGPRVQTLNAFGWRTLKDLFPYERSALLPRWRMLRANGFVPGAGGHDLITALADTEKPGAVLDLFDAFKDQVYDPRDTRTDGLKRWLAKEFERLLPESFVNSHGSRHKSRFIQQAIAEFRRYEEVMQRLGGIDFQDQKLRTLRCLQEDPEQLAHVQSMFDEVIVDEFQDINLLDCRLIDLIAERATLVITGDDDQAIYEFRRASSEFLRQPKRHFRREFASYELSVNYRCPPTILQHAQHLIGNNRVRVKKDPHPHKPEGGVIETLKSESDRQEAIRIRKWIDEVMQRSPGLTFSDFAILYRYNAQHLPLQVELFKHGVPYKVKEEHDLRITWRKALDLLDVSTCMRNGELPDHHLREQALRAYRYLPSLHDHELSEIAAAAEHDETFPGPAFTEALTQRTNPRAAQQFTSAVKAVSNAKPIEKELGIIGNRFFGDASATQEGDSSAMDELVGITNKKKRKRDAFVHDFRQFITEAAALPHAGHGAVELSTCHGAKGREWPVVILPSCNEGRFPDGRSMGNQAELEAERRLFYVSMTRAAEHLLLSYLEKTVTGPSGTSSKHTPSRFLHEAKIIEPPKLPTSPQLNGQAITARAPWKKQAPATEPTTKARTPRSARPRGAQANTAEKAPNTPTLRKQPPTSEPAEEGDMPPVRLSLPGDEPTEVTTTEGEQVLAAIMRIEKMSTAQRSQVTIRYTHPEETFPLQLACVLRGVPYAIRPAHRVLQSRLFDAVYKAKTGDMLGQRISRQDVAMNQAYRFQGSAIRGMIRAYNALAKEHDVTLDSLVPDALPEGRGDAADGIQFEPAARS